MHTPALITCLVTFVCGATAGHARHRVDTTPKLHLVRQSDERAKLVRAYLAQRFAMTRNRPLLVVCDSASLPSFTPGFREQLVNQDRTVDSLVLNPACPRIDPARGKHATRQLVAIVRIVLRADSSRIEALAELGDDAHQSELALFTGPSPFTLLSIIASHVGIAGAIRTGVWEQFADRPPAQAPEPRTHDGAADALRRIIHGYGPASPLSRAREIAGTVPRADLTCLPNRPDACRLNDNQPRIIIRVFSLGDEKPGQPLDSVEVQLTTFSNTHPWRDPSVIFMDQSVTAWAFYYREGRWVKGRWLTATAS